MPHTPTKLVRSVARRIAAVRAARQWTQEELAERADVSVRYVQMVESGTENLSLVTLSKLAAALRVHPAELLQDSVRGSSAQRNHADERSRRRKPRPR